MSSKSLPLAYNVQLFSILPNSVYHWSTLTVFWVSLDDNINDTYPHSLTSLSACLETRCNGVRSIVRLECGPVPRSAYNVAGHSTRTVGAGVLIYQ
ncbi:hypothetical protein PAXRUDRAFT_821648, partial [Paxillus rubicundulus Ve08.2h10]